MKDLTDLTVAQVRVYATDSFPYADLRVPTVLKTIKEAFNFQNIVADPIGAQFSLLNGLYETENIRVQVPTFVVESRRTQLQVRGTSEQADSFYSALWKIAFGEGRLIPIEEPKALVKVEETTCVATLDIDFGELLSPGLRQFMADGKDLLCTDFGAVKSMNFKNLAVEIKYSTDASLEEHDVVLSNKLLTIEPRMATPVKDRRFFISSPAGTDKHIELILALEQRIVSARS